MTEEQPTQVLDDVSRVQSLDTKNMLRLINELPEQCETALGIGRSFKVDPPIATPNVVYIAGAGECRLAADMAATVAREQLRVPVIADQGDRLPNCIGEGSLVFLIDYRGRSPSALRLYAEAKARAADLVVVTGGGSLLEAASEEGTRVIRIPPSQPPRTAIGYMFVPVVTALEQMGLAEGLIDKLSAGIKMLKNIREVVRFETRTERNIAKRVAQALAGKLIVVYGAADYRADVLLRWKSQINLNSKACICTGMFPDAAQIDIACLESWAGRPESIALVFLRDPKDTTEAPKMMEAARELLTGFGAVEVDIRGATTAERLLYGVYLGDYVSYYLAILNGIDPTISKNVAFMESWLAEREAEQQQAQEGSEATPPV